MTRVHSSVYLVLVLVACCLLGVEARFRCHNRCSGHGYCSDYDNICYCEDGYQGVDCSERVCPKDFAWAEKAYDVDSAHTLAECSNAGKCNRRTGNCECTKGFTGIACEKTKCGGTGEEGCNGHGDCLTRLEIFALVESRKGTNLTSLYSKNPPPWDYTHTTMCSCHIGYSGASCEYRLCPKGDDVMTPHTGYRTISFTVNSEKTLDKLSGNFQFQFNGESFLFGIGSKAFSAQDCKEAFESLRNVESVNCSITVSSRYWITYKVVFHSFPVVPYETNIFSNDGNPALSSFSCNTDQIVKVASTDHLTCEVQDEDTNKKYPEYAPCSNRGICDFTSGVCFCFQQFEFANCGSYKAAIAPASTRYVDTNQVLTVTSTNAEFDKTILALQTFDVGTAVFNSLKVTNLERAVFEMDGYGNVKMNYGGLIIGDANGTTSSGMTVNTGGLTVTGGITAESDTLVIEGRTNVEGGITVTNGGFYVVGASRFNSENSIYGGFSASGGLNLTAGLNIVAGGGTINTGGLMLYDGLTITAGGLRVEKRGVTVLSGGLIVTGGIELVKVKSSIIVNDLVEIGSDGLYVTGGITISDVGLDTGGGMSIGSGGLVVEEATMSSGGVSGDGGLEVETLGMDISGGATINDAGITVDGTAASSIIGGLTLFNSGLDLVNGLTVETDGMSIADGVTISIGDVSVICSTPVLVDSDGVDLTGGLTIGDTGFAITGGLTVVDSGLYITAGGMDIEAGGLRVTNGVSILGGGMLVTGGVTIFNRGLYSENLVQVNRGGLIITGGMTVHDAGILVTGGLTVANSGVRVTNGLTVSSGGIRATGGLSVDVTGMLVSNGLTVASSGLRVTGGLTLTNANNNVVVVGGLSISTMGLIVNTNGLTAHSSGIVVATGTTVETGGLIVTGGVSVVNLGVMVSAGGLSVDSGGLRSTGGLTLYDTSTVSAITDSMTVFSGGMITAGLSVTNNGIRINNGVTISNTGLRVTGGASVTGGAQIFSASVQDLGVRITGGLSIGSNGLVTTLNGLTALNAGLLVSGGLSLNTAGLKVTGGMSIRGGLNIDIVGLTITNNGVDIKNGMTISTDGIRSTGIGNLRIGSGGLISSNAMTVGASGLRVTGGMTLVDTHLSGYSLSVRSNGIRTSDSVQIHGGVRVYASSTVKSGGLNVYGGATVRGISFSSTTNTFTNVIGGGLLLLGAASAQVKDIGVVVAGGTTTGGLTVNGAVYLSQTPTTSDGRLKTNLTEFEDPIGMVTSLRGVYYNWVDRSWDEGSGRQVRNRNDFDESASETYELLGPVNASDPLRFVGFIAQEVQQVIPEVVKEGKSYLGVRYSELVALLIEAVKVLDQRVSKNTRPHIASSNAAYHEQISSIGRYWSPKEVEMLHKFFVFDSASGKVMSVKPYLGTCDCGKDSLDQLFYIMQRIQRLEADEAAMLQRLHDQTLL